MIDNRPFMPLVLLLLLSLPAAAEFPPEGRLSVSSYKPRQGEILVVGVRGGRGIARVEGQFIDLPVKEGKKMVEGPSLRLLSFFKTQDGDYESLLGIDLGDKPGHHLVRVYLMSPGGATTILRKSVEIKEGKFTVDRLTVDDKMVDFDEPTAARIEEERKRMEEVLTLHSPRLFNAAFRLPVQGQISSSFGRRRVLNGKSSGPHGGTDIKAPIGAVIRAPAHGTVVLAEAHYLPGNAVVLDHGLGVFTGYFHLRDMRVQPGQSVSPGDVLGFVGMTGRVTGPHLHWMGRVGGARIDPVALGRMRIAVPVPEAARAEAVEAEPEKEFPVQTAPSSDDPQSASAPAGHAETADSDASTTSEPASPELEEADPASRS